MWPKKHTSSWLDALKPRRSSTSTSSSRSSVSMSLRSGSSSRSNSLASVNSMGTVDEMEHLMGDEPRRSAYVPKHAAKSFIKTATSKDIRKSGEIL